MKNLTLEHMRCPMGDCPGVYELDDGRLLIVGKVAQADEFDREFFNGIHRSMLPDEHAIVIDRVLLSEVLRREREACVKKVQFYLDTSLVPLEFYAGKSAEWADAIKECRELIEILRDKPSA